MAPKTGRIEAQYTFAANATSAFTENGVLTTVTITAGSYYLAEIVASINTQLPGNWIVTVSDGEGTTAQSTGKCTITTTTTPFSVTWTSTSLRDALGFTANIVGAVSAQTGANACPGVWIPGCPAKFSRHGDWDAGTLVTQLRQTVGPGASGVASVYAVGGGTAYHREIKGLVWDGVPGTRVRPQYDGGTVTSTTNATLEEFLGNTQYGVGTFSSLFSINASCRVYWDADEDGSYKAGKFLWPPTFDPDTMIKGWIGRYVCPWPVFKVGA